MVPLAVAALDAKGATMNRGCSKRLPSVAVAAARGKSRCVPPRCVPMGSGVEPSILGSPTRAYMAKLI